MLKLKVMAIPSSNNKYQGQGSKVKAIKDYQKEKGIWREWIWVVRQNMKAKGELLDMQLPLQEATIIIHYNFKTKARRDPDNYSGKFILDALKDNAFIADDSFKEIDIFPLASFGQVKEDQTEIYIIPGKQLEKIVRKLIQGGEHIGQEKDKSSTSTKGKRRI